MPDFYIFMEERVKSENKKWFRKQLMSWNSTENHRDMPWKGERNPYRVWMSEIILQQTRVEQGKAYYERFINQYPDAASLAEAPEESVFKLWEGLGYYSRCKNMISAAREIQTDYGGKFPDDFANIRALPGVGPYTAAAIASFAFDQPHAVVDGNVYRVLSRFFGIAEAIDTTAGKKYFKNLSDELLDVKQPARYNQAIMDLGATVCKPRQPLCKSCPVNSGCFAFRKNKIDLLPVKSKKLVKKSRWFNFLILMSEGRVLVEKRTSKDIWENLYQFPLVEAEKLPVHENWNIDELAAAKIENKITFLFQHTQQLTHQTINGRFFTLQCDAGSFASGERWVRIEDLKTLPFPRMITRILPDLPGYVS